MLSTKDMKRRVRTPRIILKIHFYKLGNHVKLELEIKHTERSGKSIPLDNARKHLSSWTGRSCVAFITEIHILPSQ